MLTSNFNSVAEHQEEMDFNYSMKGDMENVGRIATTNSQEHKSESFIQKQKKKASDLINHIIRTQQEQILADMGGLVKDIGDLVKKQNENTDKMLTLAEIYESKDMNALRKYLENQGENTEGLSEDQLWDKADLEKAELIDDSVEFERLINDKIERYKEKREQLDPNDPDYEKNLKELNDNLKNSLDQLKDATAGRERLNQAAAWRNVSNIHHDVRHILDEGVDGGENITQTGNRTELTENAQEVVKADGFPFYFQHENVEDHSTGASPQTDIGTVSQSEHLVIGDRSYGEFDSFFSFEAKRLPTPGQYREKEYVIGHDRESGGIERFKKGIHGKTLKYAAIIGYIQKEDANHWFLKINDWISELITTFPKEWNEDDKLIQNTMAAEIAKFESKNSRLETGDHINLLHFWINLIEN